MFVIYDISRYVCQAQLTVECVYGTVSRSLAKHHTIFIRYLFLLLSSRNLPSPLYSFVRSLVDQYFRMKSMQLPFRG